MLGNDNQVKHINNKKVKKAQKQQATSDLRTETPKEQDPVVVKEQKEINGNKDQIPTLSSLDQLDGVDGLKSEIVRPMPDLEDLEDMERMDDQEKQEYESNRKSNVDLNGTANLEVLEGVEDQTSLITELLDSNEQVPVDSKLLMKKRVEEFVVCQYELIKISVLDQPVIYGPLVAVGLLFLWFPLLWTIATCYGLAYLWDIVQ